MTAIEQLIATLTLKKGFCNQATERGMAFFDAYTAAIEQATAMLPIEKQNIVDAAADAFLGSMHEEGAKGVGEQYYQNTFKK